MTISKIKIAYFASYIPLTLCLNDYTCSKYLVSMDILHKPAVYYLQFML